MNSAPRVQIISLFFEKVKSINWLNSTIRLFSAMWKRRYRVSYEELYRWNVVTVRGGMFHAQGHGHLFRGAE